MSVKDLEVEFIILQSQFGDLKKKIDDLMENYENFNNLKNFRSHKKNSKSCQALYQCEECEKSVKVKQQL